MQNVKIRELKSQIRKLKIEGKLARLGEPTAFREAKVLDGGAIKSAASELLERLGKRIEQVESLIQKQ